MPIKNRYERLEIKALEVKHSESPTQMEEHSYRKEVLARETKHMKKMNDLQLIMCGLIELLCDRKSTAYPAELEALISELTSRAHGMEIPEKFV